MFSHYLDLAWRSIRKTPMMSLLMVFAISIGIGITIMTLNVHQLMANNPAGDRSDKLYSVNLWSQGPDSWDEFAVNLSFQDVMNLRKSDAAPRKAAMIATGMALTSTNPEVEPKLEHVRATDRDFFAMFSVPFLFGGPWEAGADSEPARVVVIGKTINDALFQGKNSVGEVVYLDNKPFRVVGVIDDWRVLPKFYDLHNGPTNDTEKLFIPFSLVEQEKYDPWGNVSGWKYEDGDLFNTEKVWIQFWAELNTPAELENYRNFLDGYVDSQQQLGRFTDMSRSSWVRLNDVAHHLKDNKVVPEDNQILIGLSLLFLLVCLVNILGLMLSKFLKRAPEVGVRRAIGASKRQIFAQHLVEVGLVGMLGGCFGLLWAWGALHYLASRFALDDALTRLDPSIWFIAPGIAIGSAILAGMYPAWVICKTKPSVYLKSQ
ncbi:ABC transporter permease [Shewanella sp. FJAT-52076]|uniref:ABC transporter permease n=1 Tax=Shewanella sp. FJAT-52076 TaxID=2864202 RepID=UPI001C65CB96|nr:ABC transporter permease [Shewanella sp. FJAT-52076]QYJ74625.1 ABC transporter permease [Shewanella sp. FJAT-52076]